MKSVSVNIEQQLFVIPCGKGYSCLGFEVCAKRSESLANELGQTLPPFEKDTIEAYNEYERLCEVARKKHAETGWKSQSELIPEFIGNEGKKVEVVDKYGEKRKFIIGKSTGFIPCHLEIQRPNSSGGGSVTGYPFQSLKFV